MEIGVEETVLTRRRGEGIKGIHVGGQDRQNFP